MCTLVKFKFSGCLIATFITPLLLVAGAHAQAPSPDFNQKYANELSKARAECSRLWSNHALDPLRTKIPLGEEKPTFSMLKNVEKLNRKDRPVADLAIKTLEECNKAYEPVFAMLPPEIRGKLEIVQREREAKVAELYNGKITFGDFNVAVAHMTGEVVTAFSGIAQPPKTDPVISVPGIASKPNAVSSAPNTKTDTISSETRIALVIGNSNYSGLPKLPNPANDARAIAEIVKTMGYRVRLLIDGTEQGTRKEVRQFASDSEKADIALVFYAGHGAQVNGNNYLLPVDMDVPRSEVDIQFSALKVDDLVNSVSANTKIVFLDACRDNPVLFKNIVKGRGSVPAGLAPASGSNFNQKPGGGVFIAYATDAGSVAEDGSGKHSPFTQALLRNLQKPISIDDMFSLVTKEVRLVTKNTQRPYKYASLENIVCVVPNCSGNSASSTTPITPIEQAQRSEADDLQVAMETKKVAALETFLEKYPDTRNVSEVKSIIGSMKRAESTEWTLFAIGNKRIPWFMQLSSIQRLPDRAAIKVRYPVDPKLDRVFFGRSLPSAEWIEEINVYSCTKPVVSNSEAAVLDEGMTLLYHYKFADPSYLNLSVGNSLQVGSVGNAFRTLACNESINVPSVSRDRLALMNFKSLASTLAGDGDLFFEPLQNADGNANQKNLLFIFKYYNDRKVQLPVEAAADIVNLKNVPEFRMEIETVQLLCTEKKAVSNKSEFYDASNKLVFLTARDPAEPITDWIEIKTEAQTPLSSLYTIFCSPGEAAK